MLRLSCLLAVAVALRAQTPATANPFTSPQDAELGARIYVLQCTYCHGANGGGGRGPDLTTGQYRRGGSDAELFATLKNGVRGSEMPPTRGTDEDIWRLVAFLRRLAAVDLGEKAKGDAAAGRQVYNTKGKCAGCHAIGNSGGSLGPELTGIGRRRGVAFLQEALVKPSAEVAIPYRTIRIATKTGQTVAGIRLNEDDISIQLRDSTDTPRSFLKSKIKEIQRGEPSLMPAFGSTLTAKELEDLVAYLSSLRDEP